MTNGKTELEEAREKGLALKALHDAEILQTGTGERPRSRGQVYDIPPDDGTYCPNKVDQTGAEALDLNLVMKRFEKTGKLAELIKLGVQSAQGGFYGDFTSAPEFQDALNITIKAQEQFAALDAKVRNRFDNDPAKFLAFVGDAKNVDEMETLGLLKPEVVEARTRARMGANIKAGAPASGQAQPAPAAPAGGGAASPTP